MPKYTITHGSVRKDDKLYKPGEVIELSAQDAKDMDPDGTRLALADKPKADEKPKGKE